MPTPATWRSTCQATRSKPRYLERFAAMLTLSLLLILAIMGDRHVTQA
jgi:hypothetical protein